MRRLLWEEIRFLVATLTTTNLAASADEDLLGQQLDSGTKRTTNA